MTMSMAEDTSRIYQDRIDNLTAQLITAEESMEVMKQENSKLKNQLQQMGGEIDMVEILKAQVCGTNKKIFKNKKNIKLFHQTAEKIFYTVHKYLSIRKELIKRP